MTTPNPLKDADFEGWLASINQACGRFAAKTLGEGFSGSVQEFRTGALRLSMVDIAQTKLYRTPKEIAQSDGSYFYTVFQLSGHSEMEQEGQRALLSAGDITLIDAAKPSTFTFSDTSSQISLLLPRGYLERNLQFADLRCAQRLAAGAPMVRLSQQLVQESMRNSALDQQESEAVLDAVATLLRPALIAPRTPNVRASTVEPTRWRRFLMYCATTNPLRANMRYRLRTETPTSLAIHSGRSDSD